MKEMEELLKSAVEPWRDLEPRRDLWLEVRKRIESAGERVRFGLLDWAVAAFVGEAVVVFPKLILGLLYQV